MSNKLIQKRSRLLSIDLFKGIAAYAVVIIHTGKLMIYSGFPTNYWTIAFIEISRFAVPFFLVTSFYFMTSNLYKKANNFSLIVHLKSKIYRLLIPYLCWSAIYLTFRLVKAVSRPSGLEQLFQDPVMIIFLGGASIHLYFLPLLFLGSFLITVPEYLARKQFDLKVIVFLCISSMALYELIIISGNDFQFGANCLENAKSCSVAFQGLIKFALPDIENNQFIRVMLVALSWIIECLPYLFIAVVLNHPTFQKKLKTPNKSYLYISIVLLTLVSILYVSNNLKTMYFPRSLYELGSASSLLIIGIILSKNMKDNSFVSSLGECSFGIYLMHYLILVVYTALIDKFANNLLKISPNLAMLVLTSLTFGTSWIITYLLLRKKTISKLLFGN
jgi:fucose 4-O-acetylase-like acetyltransferase